MSNRFEKSYREILRQLDEFEIKKFGSLIGGATVSPYANKSSSKSSRSKRTAASTGTSSRKLTAKSTAKSTAKPPTKKPTAKPTAKSTSKQTTKKPASNAPKNEVPKLKAVKVVDKQGTKYLVQSTDSELKFFDSKTLKGTISRANIKGIWIKDNVLHVLKTDGTDMAFLISGYDNKNSVNAANIPTIARYLQHRKPSNKKPKKQRRPPRMPRRAIPPPVKPPTRRATTSKAPTRRATSTRKHQS